MIFGSGTLLSNIFFPILGPRYGSSRVIENEKRAGIYEKSRQGQREHAMWLYSSQNEGEGPRYLKFSLYNQFFKENKENMKKTNLYR